MTRPKTLATQDTLSCESASPMPGEAVDRTFRHDDTGERPASRPWPGQMPTGRVSGAEMANGQWPVAINAEGIYPASVAFSCVVQPQRGDLVKLCFDDRRCWILAILERSDALEALTLDFGARRVVLRAHDVRMEARNEVALDAAHIASRAEVITQVATERLTHVSGTDATHTGCMLSYAERHMGLHAKSATLTSSSLLKIDAGQIHMG
ncbi:DUF3540 domain-containing protein [Paraburkholderia susongensis]|uniref:DUF3540 domain-containing protein n=1 Tax=Paraburkholderia susongensis TaxID=1515439 RepID=A0A1X7M691_9BURK|nr:DUF3540 domain-containing protein [Paraburkholderia susongensis]SMG61227.1 Protein of unknown function [Paraburkholderia susongensis]